MCSQRKICSRSKHRMGSGQGKKWFYSVYWEGIKLSDEEVCHRRENWTESFCRTGSKRTCAMRELMIIKGVLEGKNGLQNCKSKDSFLACHLREESRVNTATLNAPYKVNILRPSRNVLYILLMSDSSLWLPTTVLDFVEIIILKSSPTLHSLLQFFRCLSNDIALRGLFLHNCVVFSLFCVVIVSLNRCLKGHILGQILLLSVCGSIFLV